MMKTSWEYYINELVSFSDSTQIFDNSLFFSEKNIDSIESNRRFHGLQSIWKPLKLLVSITFYALYPSVLEC